MEKKKTSGLFVLVVFELILLVLILISSLYQQGLNKELHAMIEEGKPSSTTETVLPPLPHFYDNCGLFRLGIEAVYRIPLEEADNYSYGYLNGMVVEPFQQDCNLKNLQVNVGGYEHDFYYAYDYSDVIQNEITVRMTVICTAMSMDRKLWERMAAQRTGSGIFPACWSFWDRRFWQSCFWQRS